MSNIQQIKQISIRAYLAEQGLHPIKDNPRYGLYLSPLREEHSPSFKVDYMQNLWYDFGLGTGGSIIDLIMRLEQCDAGEAMRRLERHIGGMSISSLSPSGFSSSRARQSNSKLLCSRSAASVHRKESCPAASTLNYR